MICLAESDIWIRLERVGLLCSEWYNLFLWKYDFSATETDIRQSMGTLRVITLLHLEDGQNQSWSRIAC